MQESLFRQELRKRWTRGELVRLGLWFLLVLLVIAIAGWGLFVLSKGMVAYALMAMSPHLAVAVALKSPILALPVLVNVLPSLACSLLAPYYAAQGLAKARKTGQVRECLAQGHSEGQIRGAIGRVSVLPFLLLVVGGLVLHLATAPLAPLVTEQNQNYYFPSGGNRGAFESLASLWEASARLLGLEMLISLSALSRRVSTAVGWGYGVQWLVVPLLSPNVVSLALSGLFASALEAPAGYPVAFLLGVTPLALLTAMLYAISRTVLLRDARRPEQRA